MFQPAGVIGDVQLATAAIGNNRADRHADGVESTDTLSGNKGCL